MSGERRENANDGGQAAVRRDDGAAGPQVVGYLDETQMPRPQSGDEEFAFVKDPPDVQEPVLYRDQATATALPLVTTVAQYWTGTEIQCDGYRLCKLVCEYTPGAGAGLGNGLLSILVEEQIGRTAGAGGAPLWAPQGVVNPTLNAPAIEPGYVYRQISDSELRWDHYLGLGAPFPAPATKLGTWNIDCSSMIRMRFRFGVIVSVGAPAETGTLNAYYQLQR